uniref:unspecific monooxygenase n=1 Tax=Heliothis virescens TaxID=7102 RepID=A0A2A4JMY4_HELVI
MFYYLPTFITIVCFLYYYFTRTFKYWTSKNVKGPTPIPFFGNFIDVFFRRKHVGVLYTELYKQYPNEKVVGLYRMMSPTLLIRDLDIVKQVLIKDFDSFPDRGVNFSKERLGDNLFHADIGVMKVLRKHLTAAFTANKFKTNFHILADRADKFIDYVENITMKESEIDTLPVFRKYGVDSIMMGAFGIDIDPYNDDDKLCDLMDKEIQTPSYCLELELLFPGALSKLNLSLFSEKSFQFCREVIEAGTTLETTEKADINRAMDVFMELRRAGNVSSGRRSEEEKELSMKITDDVLAGQVFIFYFAGYGNNSLLSTYALYHLAENPDVQELLIKDIDAVLQKHNGKFTYEALKDMKYLQMVFEETLRMHPLTNSVSRNVGRDIQLDGTDFIINKNTIVAISPYAIHHDEKNYPEPEQFRPERFSPENVKDRHPCAMISFGLGPRSCLGTRFAQLQFGICMVKFFSKYRVEWTKNTVKTITYTPMRLLLTPSERIYLRLVPRNS